MSNSFFVQNCLFLQSDLQKKDDLFVLKTRGNESESQSLNDESGLFSAQELIDRFCLIYPQHIPFFPQPCLDTGALTLENDIPGSKVYLSLGLKGRTNQNPGNPKVLTLLSSLLQKSVEKNETLLQTTQTKDVVTIFHGSRTPTLTIQQYVDRIFKYSRCSPSCFVVACIYIDRFIQSGNIILTSLNVHRLVITSIMLATKFIDDAFFNNAYYAKVGGVTTAELNRLEMQFLFGIDFRLFVSLSAFGKYCSELMNEASGQLEIERPLHAIHGACGIKENWSKNNDDSSYHPTIGIHIK